VRSARAGLSGAWYLGALLVAPTLYFFATAITENGGSTFPWSLILLYAAAAVAVVCWVRFTPSCEWPGATRGWLMLGVVVWLFVLLSDHFRGTDPASAAAALVPLSLLLILLKRPSTPECWRAADVFAWTVAAAAGILLLLEVMHAVPSWYVVHGQYGTDLITFDNGNYWLPLRDVLGLDGRWGGTTRLPNIAGQAGALLLVYGMVRPAGRRIVFVVVGLLSLLLTDSRTSYAAAAVGLCLLAALPGWGTRYWRMTPARILCAVLGIAMAVRVALKVLADPNLTGRMSMWPQFLSLGRDNLTLGAGQSGIDSAIAAGDLPAWAHQGHNLFIDALVRYGVPGLLLTLGFIAFAFVIAISGARRELGIGVALLAALVTSSMGDLGIDWTYPSDGLSVLLVSVLVSQPFADGPPRYLREADSSSVATSTTSTPSATPSD